MPAYLLALLVTLGVEAPVVAAGYRRVRRWWVGFVAVNLLTHGLLWMAWPHGAARVGAAEVMIALVEAGLYARIFGGGARRALLISVAANALSLAAGLLLFKL